MMRGARTAHRAYHTHTHTHRHIHTKKTALFRLTSYGFCHRIPRNCETEPARPTRTRAINVSAENDTKQPTVRIKPSPRRKALGRSVLKFPSSMKEHFRKSN
ncbi:hypothetical protein QQF64_011573 [Cirrhinus molitorella]|uniref:Uncharacterized protein n=1 Tax=Cirrhinus molitorella TaxID=172907 RepID=A0ABR3M335_9TELE